jgi:hypothetical protein
MKNLINFIKYLIIIKKLKLINIWVIGSIITMVQFLTYLPLNKFVQVYFANYLEIPH